MSRQLKRIVSKVVCSLHNRELRRLSSSFAGHDAIVVTLPAPNVSPLDPTSMYTTLNQWAMMPPMTLPRLQATLSPNNETALYFQGVWPWQQSASSRWYIDEDVSTVSVRWYVSKGICSSPVLKNARYPVRSFWSGRYYSLATFLPLNNSAALKLPGSVGLAA